MKAFFCAIQRHGLVCALALITMMFVTSCGSDISFVGEQPVGKTSAQTQSDLAKDTTPVVTTTDPITVEVPPIEEPVDETTPPAILVTNVVFPVPAPSPAAVPTPVVIQTTTPSADCTTPVTTVVTLMSSTFTNNARNQYIQYKLSQTDCHGLGVPINVSEIQFDVHAHVVTGRTSIPFSAYLVTAPDQPLTSGSLDVVSGMDMFGNIDSNYFYYSTSNQITIPASTYEIYLSLDYSCTIMHPSGSSGRPPATETINSYLAFGGATPVTQPLLVSNSQLRGACR